MAFRIIGMHGHARTSSVGLGQREYDFSASLRLYRDPSRIYTIKVAARWVHEATIRDASSAVHRNTLRWAMLYTRELTMQNVALSTGKEAAFYPEVR